MAGKGYVDMNRKLDRDFYTDKLAGASEKRFDTINVLPRISSKYRKSDLGFQMDKMSERDPNFMVKESFGILLSPEQQGFKPVIKGNVQFAKQKARMPMLTTSAKYQTSIYTYADGISHALSKTKGGGNNKAPSLFRGMTTMKNTTGRDNKMYFISDLMNLDETQENCFNELLTLNNIGPSHSTLSILQIPPIASTRSQVIPNSTIFSSSARKASIEPEMLNAISSFKKNKLLASSGLGLNATERTSAMSRHAHQLGLSSSLKKDILKSGSVHSTMEEKEKRPESIGEFQSVTTSQAQGGGQFGKQQSSNGGMLDSDGFEIAKMEAEDYQSLTLEQKILCGYYQAKPYLGGAYPLPYLNMPKIK